MPAVRTITIAATGDTLAHSPLWARAADNAARAGRPGLDFDPMLAGLLPVVGAADLAICHLETPIAPIGAALQTAPRYAVPAEVVDAIVAAGYDRCSTASNHALDQGEAGIARTLEVFEARGIEQSGMARRREEIAPAVFEVGGVIVSHLSYTFSYNGLTLPIEEHWRSALIDPTRIVGDAITARSLGAEVVIVSLHWGAEGVHAPTEYQRRVAAEITLPGVIDLVVGHHAHVVQPIEKVNDTWVVFGLGSILSNLPTGDGWPAATQDAIVVTVEIAVDGSGVASVGRPVAHPTWVDKQAGWLVRLVGDELARSDLAEDQRRRLERSWQRTVAVVGDFVET